MKALLLLLLTCLQLGCASSEYQKKIYKNMALSGLVGVVVGQTHDEYRKTHSSIYGAVGAALGALLTVYFEDPEKETKRLKEEVELLRQANGLDSPPRKVAQKAFNFGEEVSQEYQKLITPGEWRIYQVDRWKEEGENRLVHEDKVMELVPPALKGR